jgi:hypothetical protein
VQQIYHADPFKEEMMTEWETRPAVNKTWERCTQYFLQAADKLRIHQKATAKQSGYHSAANVQEKAEKAEKVAQEEAERAAEQEEQVNMVLEAFEKSGEQMNAVAATNAKLKATIAELTKRVSKLTEMNSNLVKALIAAGKEVAVTKIMQRR